MCGRRDHRRRQIHPQALTFLFCFAFVLAFVPPFVLAFVSLFVLRLFVFRCFLFSSSGGHDFSRAVTRAATKGALAPAVPLGSFLVLRCSLPSSSGGHDFSRAATRAATKGALAPAVPRRARPQETPSHTDIPQQPPPNAPSQDSAEYTHDDSQNPPHRESDDPHIRAAKSHPASPIVFPRETKIRP